MTDLELLARFVETFETVDDGYVSPADVPRDALADDLDDIAQGRRLPPLYEQLILSYRWPEVDVGRVCLLPSLPPGLRGLADAIRCDDGLYTALAPSGYFQFAKGPNLDYDPVCFDLRTRRHDGDCRIVKFDHEQILCNYRLVEVAEIAPSLRRLIELAIDDAKLTSSA